MSTTPKSTILIVDDKPANIYALQKLLDKKDRLLLEATSGKDALKIALSHQTDLIILDVQMPDMDGFEVAAVLKSNRRTQDIPIIFASAEKKEQESILKGFEEGAADYLSKPLDAEVTKAKVAVMLKLQAQKKELIEKNISLEKSHLLINNSADIIGIIDVKTFHIEEVNEAFTQILGYPVDEIKGNSLALYLSNESRSVLNTQREKTDALLSFETRIYTKDRQIKWLGWRVTVKDGKWYANARDITEVKQVERIRNYLTTVVKQSKDAIYIHDNEGRIISWNEGAENIYGYDEEDALHMKIWNIIPEHLLTEMHHTVNKIIEGNKVEALETKRITRDGELVDVLFSASVIKDSGNLYSSVAITERNVTVEKMANEKINRLNYELQKSVADLEASNKELESFSYSVSHDLRAPLRGISGFCAMLEEEHAAAFNDDAKHLMAEIQLGVKKMNHLIDDLLAFSKLGRKEVLKTPASIHNLVQGITREINIQLAHRAKIEIKELHNACVDRSLMSQVWVNLISNAIKYSSKKETPVIEIGSHELDDDIVYYVKDNGAGFDMRYAEKLFKVFQRLHGHEDFEGTGIGLAIVNRIVNKHGGRVWAEAAVNEGATFYFSIPKITMVDEHGELHN